MITNVWFEENVELFLYSWRCCSKKDFSKGQKCFIEAMYSEAPLTRTTKTGLNSKSVLLSSGLNSGEFLLLSGINSGAFFLSRGSNSRAFLVPCCLNNEWS